MKQSYIVSNYCSIRKNLVVVNCNIAFSDATSGSREFFNAVYRNFAINYPKFHKMDNLSKLGFLSAELLLRDKNTDHKYSGSDVAIILMNSSSSLCTDRDHQNTISDRENYFPSPSIFVYTLPNVVIGEICIRHKFYGEGNFFVTEKFNPVFMVNYVKQLFDSETIQCCIAGWVEFDGNDFESVVFLIEKPDKTDDRIANFEPDAIQSLYLKNK